MDQALTEVFPTVLGQIKEALAVLLPYAGLALIVLIIRVGYYYFRNFDHYKQSDYYKSTHYGYWKVRFDKGLTGEYLTYRKLLQLKGYKRFLFNCYIPKAGEDKTEIDLVLLHESGIYVMESKNYSGWIYGTETQKYWTQTLPGNQKRSFYNPIKQNIGHIKWMQTDLRLPENLFYSYIVFSERCNLKKINRSSYTCHLLQRQDLLPDQMGRPGKKETLFLKKHVPDVADVW